MINLTDKIYEHNQNSKKQRKYDCVNYNNTRALHLTCAICKGKSPEDCEVIYKPCLLEMNYIECPEFKQGRI